MMQVVKRHIILSYNIPIYTVYVRIHNVWRFVIFKK